MMKFTSVTLRSTADQFRKALAEWGIQIDFSSSLNLWSQIVVGKNHSSAMPQARKHGEIAAVPVSAERIIKLFGDKHRDVDKATTVALFAEAIRHDLYAVCGTMQRLCQSIGKEKGLCVDGVGKGLGLFDKTRPGYVSVHSLDAIVHEDELAWLVSSADFASDVTNYLAGLSSSEASNIVLASIRQSFEFENDVFKRYFSSRIPSISREIAEAILRAFEPGSSVDFDEIHEVVHQVIEEECGRGVQTMNGWLKTSCDTCKALLDHVAARAREELDYLDEDEDEWVADLAVTIEGAINRIFR
jgi:hypothetical protein